ncbi:MAG: PocR ligand-binding domain-containing protein [Spirochaetales bacterium]|nr:PocR ligand-binding domain-containing protein [Spirochaetales bacterium]
MQDDSRKKILLVEDEVLISLNETMTLEKDGYDVVTAVSGEEAVSIIKSGTPVDLVLMDINLGSGISGTTAAEIILEEADIPLIFMSSYTEKQVVSKTEGITSYGYIVKNTGETVMLTSIRMAFKLYNAKKFETGMWKATSVWEKTIDSISDSILLIDCDSRIVKYNKAFSDFIGSGDAELSGRKCMELVHGLSSEYPDCPFGRMKNSLKRERLEMEINGIICEVIVDPIFDDKGRLNGAVHIISDISVRKFVEDELKQKIQYLTHPEVDGNDLTFLELFDIKQIQKLQDDFASAHGIASMITYPDGTPITRVTNFSRFCFIVRSTKQGLKNCLISDSELSILSESGPRVQKCLSCGLLDAGAGITVEGKHIASWFIGQVRDESITEDDIREKIRKIGADEEAAVEAFYELPVIPEEKFEALVGLLHTMAGMLSESAYRNFLQARMISRISESENKIKQLLAEKSLLLKEVYHRVKNNISSLGALLSMQLEFAKEPEAIAAIKDAVARINSSKIIYEKLLNTEGYDALPVRPFVMDLYNEISRMYDRKSKTKASICIDEIVLDAELLFPLGIMINELLTNMFKHAFDGMNDAEIIINILKNDDYIDIELMDNGSGMPDNVAIESVGSYGLKLVKMLAAQIGSDLSIDNRIGGSGGTACRFKIMTFAR